MDSICRLCLNTNAIHYESISCIEQKYFQLVLPEVDIQLVQKPAICQCCVDLLQTTYTFKSNCIQTEEMLKSYASSAGHEGPLLLSDVIQNEEMNRDIKAEPDFETIDCDVNISEEGFQTEIKVENVDTNNTIKPKFKCDICGKQFVRESTLTKHTLSHRDNKTDSNSESHENDLNELKLKTRFKCDQCTQEFAKQKTLSKHKSLVHSGKKSAICEYCSKAFISKARVRVHVMRCHLGIKPKVNRKFTCDTCGFSTATNYTLQQHIRTHTGEKPFKCELCDKRFAQNSSVRTHMMTAHSTERSYTCEYCSKSFKVKWNLNKHIFVVHTGPQTEKKFVCNLCGKGFLLRCKLTQHMRWHNNDRKYSCDLCVKTFVDNYSLTKHRVIHFAEKKHKCEICGKGFHQKSNIKIHMKVHGTPI